MRPLTAEMVAGVELALVATVLLLRVTDLIQLAMRNLRSSRGRPIGNDCCLGSGGIFWAVGPAVRLPDE